MEFEEIIMRKFANSGDIIKAVELLTETSGVERTRALAISHVEQALSKMSGLFSFTDNIYEQALLDLSLKVITREY